MKKIVAMFIMAMLTMQVAIADDVVTKDVNKLPALARETVQKHFSDAKISYIKIDKDLFQSATYEVTLTNGAEIDFDSNGQWMEIDCKKMAVPAAFIPAAISKYMSENFPQQRIVKFERDRRGYDAELNNGLEVKFDQRGTFLKLDD